MNKKETIDEHRLIMQNYLGRKLSRFEVVHHKNGIKNDNRLENLELMSLSEHSREHMIGHVPANKIIWPEGKAWCSGCKQFKLREYFSPYMFKSKRRGIECKNCRAIQKANWRLKTKRH